MFISFEYMPRSQITESYSSSISNLLRKLNTVYQFTFPPVAHVSPHPYQHLSVVFLIMATLIDVSDIVVLICTSLNISDVEYFRIPISHLYVFCGKWLFSSSVQFKSCCLFVCYWVLWVLYIIWILTPFQIYDLHIFSHSLVCHFICWLFLLLCRSFLVWYSPTY